MRTSTPSKTPFLLPALALLSIAGAFTTAEAAPGRRAGWQRPLVLAEYHVWHGLPCHSEAFSGAFWLPQERPRAYDSRDPSVLAEHIERAKAAGIDGFVVDWYGPPDTVPDCSGSCEEDPKDCERSHMDQATAGLLSEAEARDFRVALLYDEGTVRQAESSPAAYQARVISDLTYAMTYFGSPAYLRLGGKPALFVFPYADVDPHVDWAAVRAALGQPVTLIDQDPDPRDPGHDDLFDGFFAWVQPGAAGWDGAGRNWGKKYLKWFYSTLRSAPYGEKIAVGGTWPGFDDSLAPWGSMRFMSRRDGRVYEKTWKLARRNRAPIVLIATWNDFEEGTDIEFGLWMVVDMESSSPEVLLRSSPLEVVWEEARGEGVVQVYRTGNLIYEQRHRSGVYFAMESGVAYEIKLWVDGRLEPFAKAVKIRAQDPIARVSPIVVD